jgi:hypothetical protein
MFVRDTERAEARSWRRFIDAFEALVAAQDAIVDASQLQNPHAVQAFARAELLVRGASLALIQASAGASLPVAAMMNATLAQQAAESTLSNFPALTSFGPNLLLYDTLQDKLRALRDETRRLLDLTLAAGVS